MARHYTAEETEAEHLAAMGPELGALYHRLWNEVSWLHLKWRQYEELYGSSEERVDILNASASLFFRIIQDSLWEDILLHLCALTDPETTGRKENLTLRRFPALISNDTVRASVNAAVEAAVSATDFARDWRNRRIAHRDLALAISDGAEPLASASRATTRLAVEALCEVIRQVSLGSSDSDVFFGGPPQPNDAVSLLYVLRDGVEADQARRERLRSGTPDPDDLLPPRAL
jgi:hypothetical protein